MSLAPWFLKNGIVVCAEGREAFIVLLKYTLLMVIISYCWYL